MYNSAQRVAMTWLHLRYSSRDDVIIVYGAGVLTVVSWSSLDIRAHSWTGRSGRLAGRVRNIMRRNLRTDVGDPAARYFPFEPSNRFLDCA
jgi:hypothetical protein